MKNVSVSEKTETTSLLNLALLDPPRWGWSAFGGIVDLLTPQERARRASSRDEFLQMNRKRQRIDDIPSSVGKSSLAVDSHSQFDGKTQETSNSLESSFHSNPDSLTNYKEDSSFVSKPFSTLDPCVSDLPLNQRFDDRNSKPFSDTMTKVEQEEFSNSRVVLESDQPVPTSSDLRVNEDFKLNVPTRSSSKKCNSLSASGTDRPTSKYSMATLDDKNYNVYRGSNSSKAKTVIKVKALDEQNRLNIHAYHRGIAGFEPREVESGRLIGELKPHDTNYAWTEPNLNCTIHVSFPLGDSQSESEHYFSQYIEWDLSNPKTVAPIVFATYIGDEYGLTPFQIQNLASSIQMQIDAFVTQHAGYRIPITFNDPNGIERSDDRSKQIPGFIYPKTLYGGCNARNIAPTVSSQGEQNGNQESGTNGKARKSALPSSKAKPRPISTQTNSNRTSLDKDPCSKGVQEKVFFRKKSLEVTQHSKVSPTKVPMVEFPREVDGIYDIDPSQPDDYRTKYTSNGPILLPDLNPFPDRYEIVPAEKVYEDFEPQGECFICQISGLKMVRCRICPRLYHRECFSKSGESGICSACNEDEQGISVNDTLHIDTLDNVYKDYSTELEYKRNISVLSFVITMIDYLIEYDFGDVFACPVDLIAYPEYGKRIERPMDLGTVRASILNGEYCKRAESCSNGSRMDHIIFDSLKDIETVWFNCLSFNVEGSVVKRAGELQKRKYTAILNTVEEKLSLKVKDDLAAFRSSCDELLSKEYENKQRRLLPISNRFITVKTPKIYKIVAVWDIETSMLVKLYSSVKGALAAYHCLLDLGHSPGFTPTDLKSFTQFLEFPISSENFLFGYKWILLDNLKHWRRKTKDHDSKGMIPKPFVPKGFTGNFKYVKILKVKEREQILACFDCIEKVVADWCETCKLSLRPTQSSDSLQNKFMTEYLDHERHIDGIFWRSASSDQHAVTNVSNSDGERLELTQAPPNDSIDNVPQTMIIGDDPVPVERQGDF